MPCDNGVTLRLVLLMPQRAVMVQASSYLTWKRRGFTLPEILIVIVMISLLALVAIPRFASANGKRHLESARMRVAAAATTARQAAIQKAAPIRFRVASNRVTVINTATGDTLMSKIPLDTLYKVTVTRPSQPFTIDFSGRGFPTPMSTVLIELTRTGGGIDTVIVSKTGMVQQ